MSERKPLTTLHNGCSAHRTVRRTYGRKGKASGATGSQNFFSMVDEVENKKSRFDISEIKEDCGKENEGLLEPIQEKEPTKTVIKASKKPECSTKTAKKQRDISASKQEDLLSGFAGLSLDEHAVTKFTKEFSNHGITSFKTYGKDIGESYDVKKIGEGVYSSVFALTSKDTEEPNAATGTDSSLQTTIIKMMPISLPSQGESTGMTEPSLIATEIQTLKAMDPIHGFIRYRGVAVVQGGWPVNFIEAFRNFKITNKATAINEDPETAFDSDQYYALIEMEDAGKELNYIVRPTDFQIYDIFWSICIQLANAENQVQFEHRDLHISNICVKPSNPATSRIDIEQSIVENMQVFPDTFLGMSNITTTIIDYTYSRVTPQASANDKQKVTFRPAMLSDHEYDDVKRDFIKKRSRETRDDFEIRTQDLTYSKVIKCVYLTYDRDYDPRMTPHIPAWETHVPKTNVCWLGYLITCLLQRAGKISRTKYVERSNDIAKKVQDSMREKMSALKECLMREDIDDIPESATDVVRIGVEKGWLKKEEIEAFKKTLEKDS